MTPVVRRATIVFATVTAVYGMICADVVLRARHAYQEGEKYTRWADFPSEKQQFLQGQLAQVKSNLSRKLEQKTISPTEYKYEVELADFEYQQQIAESSIKYAYIWYQTAAELFTPPQSTWVKQARAKMPIAKARWIAELKAKNIVFQPYMID